MTNIEFPLWLYHGTAFRQEDKSNKLTEFKDALINPVYWKNRRDFGKGFYTTIDLEQAKAFGIMSANKKVGNIPCVLKIHCHSGNYLHEINHQVFLGASRKWSDYILSNRVYQDDQLEAFVITGPLADNKISNIVSHYKKEYYEDPNWFFDKIMRKPKGQLLEGFGLGNQVVFKEPEIAKKIITVQGYYLFSNERWEYYEDF